MVDPDARLKALQTGRLVQIGNICSQWSSLEYAVAQLIWILLGVNQEVGKIVTGGLDMLPRINMAINLARELKAPRKIVDKLVAARKELQDGLADRRNEAVHGVQFLFPPSTELLVEVHRGRGDRKRKQLSEADLMDLGQRLHSLQRGVAEVVTEHAQELRRALLAMAEKIRETVSAELNGPKSV